MTHATYTYVALGLEVVVGLPLVWGAAAALSPTPVRLTRALTAFSQFLLAGLIGLSGAFALGRLWVSLGPAPSTALFAPVLLAAVIGPALLVFATHSAILHRLFRARRQVAMLVVLLLWVGWYALGHLVVRTGAALLL